MFFWVRVISPFHPFNCPPPAVMSCTQYETEEVFEDSSSANLLNTTSVVLTKYQTGKTRRTQDVRTDSQKTDVRMYRWGVKFLRSSGLCKLE